MKLLSHASGRVLTTLLVTALVINGPVAMADPLESPTPEVGVTESAAPDTTPAAETPAETASTDGETPPSATEEPASESAPADADATESAPADADQAPMVDPVEDTDDSATTDEESAPADAESSAPGDVTDGAPLEVYVPGIKVVRADQSATILWPDFGAEENYVVQLEQADGTWKSVEKDVEPADTSLIEGPVGLVDNQATVQGLANDQSYTARIASAETLEQAERTSEPGVDLSVGGPRGGAMAGGLALAADGDGTAVVTPPIGISPFAVPPATGNDAVITVKVGGDRSGQTGVTGLAGVTLQLYVDNNGTPGAEVTDAWATCVSDPDGDCSFTVPNTQSGGANRDKRFWIQRTGSPTGWFGLNSLVTGAIDNTPPLLPTPYRFRTGNQLRNGTTYRSTPPDPTFMNATGNTTRDASGGIWQTSRNNPTLAAKCGLNVALVLDVSGSVGADLNNLKTAAKTSVNALVGTPSQVGLFTFSTNAPASGTNNQNRPLTPVSTQSGADQVNAWIGTGNNNSPGRTGLTSGGSTNWDRGFAQVAESPAKFDVAVVITDGNPTVYGNPAQGPGNFTRFREMENGIFSANAIKKENTRVIAFGVGSGVSGDPANLQAISGTTVNSDYFQTNNYDTVGQALRALALGKCKGTITVVKQVLAAGSSDLNTATPAGGWTFDAVPSLGVTVSPASGQTASATGALSFDLTFPGGTSSAPVALTETPQAGYTLFKQGVKNATCTRLDTNAPVTVENNGPNGFNVLGQRDYPISCKVYNQENPQQAKLTLVKTVSGGPALPTAWTLTAAGPSTITGASGASAVTGATVPTGTFNLSESGGPAGYSPSAWVCTGTGQTQTTTSVTLAKGADATCTITNIRDTASLKITKVFDKPAGLTLPDGFAFTLPVTCSDTSFNQDVTFTKADIMTGGPALSKTISGVPTGTTCTVKENTPSVITGWTWGTPTFDPTNAANDGAVVTSTKDRTVEATVTNTIIPQVTLVKAWVDGFKGDTSELTITGGTGGAPVKTSTSDGKADEFRDDVNTASATVQSGAMFSIAEVLGTANTGSYGSSWICTSTDKNFTPSGQGRGSGELTMPNAPVTCEFINTRSTNKVTLVKAWVDGFKGDTADLTISGGITDPAENTSTATGDPGLQLDEKNAASTDVFSGEQVSISELLSVSGRYTAGWECTTAVPTDGEGAAQARLTGGTGNSSSFKMPNEPVVCTFTNTRDTAQVKLQKAWVNGRGGDTAALTIKGGVPDSGTPAKTSTATGATGTVLDTTNVANATVLVGDTVTVTEVLGASNLGKYGSALVCTAGEEKVKVDDKGNFTMPNATVTCTFTNDRTVVVPTQPTVTAEVCDPNVPGAQLPGSITIPANPDYAYFIEGVATAAGTYPKSAGSYKVAAQLIVTKPVSASALQQLAAQDVYTWTVVVPGSPVCPLLVKESNAGTGSVITGQTVGYTITAKNGGDTAVVGETLVDTLPAGVNLITSSINPAGTYNATARTITWKFDLPAAVGTTPATATFTYQVTVTASSGSIVNSVSWVERSLTATTSNTVTSGTVGGVEETPDEPDNVVGGSEDLPPTGAGNSVNVAGFGLLAMVLGGLMVGFGRRRRRREG